MQFMHTHNNDMPRQRKVSLRTLKQNSIISEIKKNTITRRPQTSYIKTKQIGVKFKKRFIKIKALLRTKLMVRLRAIINN